MSEIERQLEKVTAERDALREDVTEMLDMYGGSCAICTNAGELCEGCLIPGLGGMMIRPKFQYRHHAMLEQIAPEGSSDKA